MTGTPADGQLPAVRATASTASNSLLDVVNVVRHFRGRQRRPASGHSDVLKAVDGVSLDVARGETVALVGESGCGKSTLARLLTGLETADAGHVWFDGIDALTLKGAQLRRYRRNVQMIFQDPYASLNPRITVGEAIMRGWEIHRGMVPRPGRRAKCVELIETVGLRPDRIDWYPYMLSGGQRQRVNIAAALALEPRLIICDEPLSALDVSAQARIITLLQDLQARLHVSYLFISHDLAAVRTLASRLGVMYLGRIVESGSVREIYERPAHPYTQALLLSVPSPDPRRRNLGGLVPLDGDPPSPANLPSGCRFRTRCPRAQSLCVEVDPILEAVRGQSTHKVACHFPNL